MFKINGVLIIFKNPNKFNTKLRLLAPFVMLLDGIIELLLLPTPYSSYIYNKTSFRDLAKTGLFLTIKKLRL